MPRSISTKGQPEPTFYVDENLGRTFTSLLRAKRTSRPIRARPLRARDSRHRLVAVHRKSPPDCHHQGQVGRTERAGRGAGARRQGLRPHGACSAVRMAALFLKRQKRVRSLIASHEGAFVARIYFDEGIRVIPPEEILSRLSRYRDYRQPLCDGSTPPSTPSAPRTSSSAGGSPITWSSRSIKSAGLSLKSLRGSLRTLATSLKCLRGSLKQFRRSLKLLWRSPSDFWTSINSVGRSPTQVKTSLKLRRTPLNSFRVPAFQFIVVSQADAPTWLGIWPELGTRV